jgi:carboxyl-terminal processing protease
MNKIDYYKNSRKVLILFILFFSLVYYKTYPQRKISSVTKYKEAGLVWGLLKYHHPEVSNGKYNWDLEFINLYDKIETIENQEVMNELLLNFISKFKIDKFKTKKIKSEGVFIKNEDYNWINPTIFGEKLTKSLLEIKENSNKNNFYASTDLLAKMLSFKNEKGYPNFNFKIRSHRLLLLYSFWNAIQYWDVNKYLTAEKWIDILDSMTEEFINCNTILDFEIAKSKLFAKLNDSHAYYCSKVVNDSLFKYKPIFSVKAINDSLLINSISNKSLSKRDKIELGDIIIKVNNKDISACINEKIAPLLSVSNLSFLKKFSNWILFCKNDSINVDILKKNGKLSNQYIHLYNKYVVDEPEYLDTKDNNNFVLIKPEIAYIDLDKITIKELNVALKKSSKTKGLILDLRNYPKNISNVDLAAFLYPQKMEFIKVLFPIENNPSYAEYDGEAPLKLIANPFNSGINNPDYYKGKVVLLVNKKTQSKAEFIGMTIQKSPNCVTIGEQTAGSVLNVVSFKLPDMTEINFTGLGAFYPNGEGAQSNGLHIDYFVKESAYNYDPELYIKDAIKIIESKN